MLATVQHNELSKTVVGEYAYYMNNPLDSLYLRETGEHLTGDSVYIGDVHDGVHSIMVGRELNLDHLDKLVWKPLYKGDTITIKL